MKYKALFDSLQRTLTSATRSAPNPEVAFHLRQAQYFVSNAQSYV